MSDRQLKQKDLDYVLNNNSLKVGLLIESLSGSYQSGIWEGIQEVAKQSNVNSQKLLHVKLNLTESDLNAFVHDEITRLTTLSANF